MSETPTTIAALVAGVLARLQAKVDGYAIEAFPADPKEYVMRHQRGAFLVAYRGADYGGTVASDAIAQARGMQVDVVVLGRALTGAGSSYDMLDAARVALVGHTVDGFEPLAAVRERFLGRAESVWMYQLTVGAATLAVQLDDETTDVLLEHLTIAGDFATSEIPNA